MKISDVRVASDAEGTLVDLYGVDDPTYTAFELDDPRRVVVELSGVGVGSAADAVAVYDGTVDEIRVDSWDDESGRSHSRIEISVAEPVSYDVTAFDQRLQVRVTRGEALAATEEEEAPAAADPWAMDESWEEPTAADQATSAGALAAAEPATQLLGVSSDAEGNLRLQADGPIAEVQSFTLENPTRLVIDLPGLVSRVPNGRVDAQMAEIGGIRVGQHEGKVRVVLDAAAGSGELAVPEMLATSEGLTVAFQESMESDPGFDALAAESPQDPPAFETGSFEETADASDDFDAWAEEQVATDEPTPASFAAETTETGTDAWLEAPAEQVFDEAAPIGEVFDEAAPAEPTFAEGAPAEQAATFSETPPTAVEPDDGTVTVYGVQFDAQGGRDRVAVLTDDPVRYEITEPADDTLVVRLFGASIDPEAAVRIAPETIGSVAMVRAFQQPEADTPEVRVVVRRADGMKPEVSQYGSTLFLDFPHGRSTAAAVPMLDGVGEETRAASTTTETAAPAEAMPPAPEAVPAAIEPLASVEILEEGGLTDGKDYVGRRISLDFKDVDIADVLRLIAEVSDLNIIAGGEVEGDVTIRLVDVPWDQALDVILLTKGLGFVRVGNVLRIAPNDILKAEEEARLQERRAKEKLEDLVVKLQPVNYASVDEVSQMVKRLLTARGTVDVDQRTNTIIMKDISSVIDEATALIKAIDTQTPQVLIEAKIVEANLDFSREIGSTWAFGTQPLVDGFDSGSDPRRDLGGEDFKFHNNPLLTGFTDTFNHVSVANPITSVANGLLDLGAFILNEKFNVELRLEAAESNGEGKVISSPRIVTLDNREATIEQGVSIPFQTFENGDAQLQFIDAVLKLEVTPHVTADRSIIMAIEVQRNAPDDSVPTPTGSPAIAKNQAKTETLVRDGQTLVIGGIYVVSKSDRSSRIPYLHRIPLVGNAFKNSEVRDIRQELLVFVTPRIVVNPEIGS